MRHLSPARKLLPAVALLLGAGVSAAAWRTRLQATRPTPPAASMASMLPEGALLTIESPDFSALLKRWNDSPEQRSWLSSDNFSAFSNSRLFGRLNDARAEFEAVAAPPGAKASLDGGFLAEVAGARSIFAWYDVGQLEFLYVSEITPAQAGNLSLLKNRSAYTARQAGNATFYLRKTSDRAAAASAEEGSAAQGNARTIAFAEIEQNGSHLLLLGTREDLVANALLLMQHATGAETVHSVAQEAWFSEADAALDPAGPAPNLHMVLNLDRIVPLPYFRSYWVQQNITEMKQYRAAVSDLRLGPAAFQEERALLLKSTDDIAEDPALGDLAALAPAGGVFRAVASADADSAVSAVEEKLLGQTSDAPLPETDAPDPSLDTPQSGSGADLETRIDAPTPHPERVADQPLSAVFQQAGLRSLLTWSSASAPPQADALWIRIHSAVVLHAANPWNLSAIEAALQTSVRGNLTTGGLGVVFSPAGGADGTIYTLSGPRPLYLATHGTLLLLADDRAVLEGMLGKAAHFPATTPPSEIGPTRMAAFDHNTERGPFGRLTALVDGTNHSPDPGAPPAAPAFFSGNLRSLSNAFAPMTRQEFSERRQGSMLRQTVVYRWQNP